MFVNVENAHLRVRGWGVASRGAQPKIVTLYKSRPRLIFFLPHEGTRASINFSASFTLRATSFFEDHCLDPMYRKSLWCLWNCWNFYN